MILKRVLCFEAQIVYSFLIFYIIHESKGILTSLKTSEPKHCKGTDFQCPSDHRCIPLAKICDGKSDCGDSSDEARPICLRKRLKQSLNVCANSMFLCQSDGRCIDERMVCDREFDCHDKTDEKHCAFDAGRNSRQCHHKCDDKSKCILEEKMCDGVADCSDKSDETHCSYGKCMDGHRRCGNSTECVSGILWCNGFPNCKNKADELNCPLRCDSYPERNVMCDDRKSCYYLKNQCDGVKNCADGSDEKHCDPPTFHHPSIKEKAENSKKCKKGEYEILRKGHTMCVAPNNPCHDFGRCPHICTPKDSFKGYECQCQEGFRPEGLQTCVRKKTRGMAYLLSATEDKIQIMGPTIGGTKVLSEVPFHSEVTFMDYAIEDKTIKVFWVEQRYGTTDRIRMTSFDTQSRSVVSQTSSLIKSPFKGRISGLSYDWVERLLYFSDSKHLIAINVTSGRWSSVYVAHGGPSRIGMELLVEPLSGYMYYVGTVEGKSGGDAIAKQRGQQSWWRLPLGQSHPTQVAHIKADCYVRSARWDYTQDRLTWLCGGEHPGMAHGSWYSMRANGTNLRVLNMEKIFAASAGGAALQGYHNYLRSYDIKNQLLFFSSDLGSILATKKTPEDSAVGGSATMIDNYAHATYIRTVYPPNKPQSILSTGRVGDRCAGHRCEHICVPLMTGTTAATAQSYRCECPRFSKLLADGRHCMRLPKQSVHPHSAGRNTSFNEGNSAHYIIAEAHPSHTQGVHKPIIPGLMPTSKPWVMHHHPESTKIHPKLRGNGDSHITTATTNKRPAMLRLQPILHPDHPYSAAAWIAIGLLLLGLAGLASVCFFKRGELRHWYRKSRLAEKLRALSCTQASLRGVAIACLPWLRRREVEKKIHFNNPLYKDPSESILQPPESGSSSRLKTSNVTVGEYETMDDGDFFIDDSIKQPFIK